MVKSNKEHLHKVESNIGTLTVIQTIRKNKPKNLKRPYEYVLPIKKARELNTLIKATIKKYGIQITFLDTKSVTYGQRFSIFLLGNCTEISKKDWIKVNNDLEKVLQKFLGKDARLYTEDYNTNFNKIGHINAPYKFQARFQTYIAFKELYERNTT